MASSKWRRTGRNNQADSGYSLTNGYLTLIVPYSAGNKGVHAALEYLNSFHHLPATKPKKVCLKCGRAMLRHHKYTFVTGGLEHRHCDDPTGY